MTKIHCLYILFVIFVFLELLIRCFIELGLSQSFLEYGLWQNFGTGKEIPRGNKGDIGRERKRKKKPWFSRKYYASIMNLRDILSDNIANEFVGVVAQALDDKYVRYNH